MGWTGTSKRPGESTLEFLRREFAGTEVIDGAMSGRTMYLAVKLDGEVRAYVVLIEGGGNSIAYKEMHEGMGPCEDDCPPRIFALLTPLKGEEAVNGDGTPTYAAEWRARVQAKLAKKAEQPKIKPGVRIRTAKPLRFRNGMETDLFEHVRRNTFYADPQGNRFLVRFNPHRHEFTAAA
jgi:hypothetical protein